MEDLVSRIKRHEGFCKFPKPDNQFKGNAWVIGYGCDISQEEARTTYSDGITPEDAEHLLSERLNEIEERLFDAVPWLLHITDENRVNLVVEMAFQMGVEGVKKFPRMLHAIQDGDWGTAADEMLDSTWHKQTPSRCEELAELMRNGE